MKISFKNVDIELSDGIYLYSGMFRGKNHGGCQVRLNLSIHKKIIGAPSFLSLGKMFNSEKNPESSREISPCSENVPRKNRWKAVERDQTFAPRNCVGP